MAPAIAGATGGGATNDTAAVQAAVDSGATTINFINGASYLLNPIYIKDSDKTLLGNGCSLISSSNDATWALINAIKTDSPDLYLRPSQWQTLMATTLELLIKNATCQSVIVTF